MSQKLLFWLPTLIWAALIFGLSSFQTVKTTEFYWQDFLLKKTAHFIEYFILFSLIYRSLKNTSKYKFVQLLTFALALTVLYAASDEIHQTFVPSREGRLRDVVIDTAGAVTALFIIKNYLPNAPHQLKLLAKKIHLI